MDKQNIVRLAGISGIIGSTLPLIMILASTVIEKSFSWNKNALSDIGVSQTAWLFNSALIVGGLLNLLFAIGLWKYFDKTKRVKIGVSLVIISSISLALVGVFTENYGVLHPIVALGYLLLTPLGLICIGVGKKSDQTGKVSLVFGIIALLAIFGLSVVTFGANLQIGFAVPEFAESLTLSIWTFWMSLKLLCYRISDDTQLSKRPLFIHKYKQKSTWYKDHDYRNKDGFKKQLIDYYQKIVKESKEETP